MVMKWGWFLDQQFGVLHHGSLNVPMFHITQPLDSIRYMVYNGYYKVMSNIPKMGHLTTPVHVYYSWLYSYTLIA